MKNFTTNGIKNFDSLTEEHKQKLIFDFFEDIKLRYAKYGESASTGTNVKYTAGLTIFKL